MNKGSYIPVDGTKRYKTHIEVANELFGKQYKGHQSAIIKLDNDWVIWFPKLYKNGDWDNEITDDGKKVTMKYVPGGQYSKGTIYSDEDSGKCIIFGQKIDKLTKQKYYAFVGVFTKLKGTYADARCERISDTLYVDCKGGFSITPL